MPFRSDRFPKKIDVFVHHVSDWNAPSRKNIFINNSKRGEVSNITNKITIVIRTFIYLFVKSRAKWHRIVSHLTPPFSGVQSPYILQMFCYLIWRNIDDGLVMYRVWTNALRYSQWPLSPLPALLWWKYEITFFRTHSGWDLYFTQMTRR